MSQLPHFIFSLCISVFPAAANCAEIDRESPPPSSVEGRAVQAVSINNAAFETLALLDDGTLAIGGGSIDRVLIRVTGISHIIGLAVGSNSALFLVDSGDGISGQVYRWDYRLEHSFVAMEKLHNSVAVSTQGRQLSALTASGEIIILSDVPVRDLAVR